jgi:hypothetical protein
MMRVYQKAIRALNETTLEANDTREFAFIADVKSVNAHGPARNSKRAPHIAEIVLSVQIKAKVECKVQQISKVGHSKISGNNGQKPTLTKLILGNVHFHLSNLVIQV